MSAYTAPSTAALLRGIPAPPAPHTVEHGLFSSILGSAAASSGFHDAERKYTIIKSLGTGSFGTVYVADWHSALPSGAMVPAMQHSYTRPAYAGKRLVAIKRMKKPFASWDDCIKLNELRSLLIIPPHDHIIPLYDVFLPSSTRELHIVFECMEGNLYQLTKTRKGRPLAKGLIASILRQVLLGLDHVHSHGFFHRDLKPENLLITTVGLGDYPAMPGATRVVQDVLVIVKIADFGLAREAESAPPYTEYVSTRWYRAPEILLHAPEYSPAVDVWALGTIMAELSRLEPLFPGSSELDQVLRITAALGSPLRKPAAEPASHLQGGGYWPEAAKYAERLGFLFPDQEPVPFAPLFPVHVSENLIQLIYLMLRYDPQSRMKPSDYLQHPYLTEDAPLLKPRAKLVPQSSAPMASAEPMPSRQRTAYSMHSSPTQARRSGEDTTGRTGALHSTQLHDHLRQALELNSPTSSARSSPSGFIGAPIRLRDSSGLREYDTPAAVPHEPLFLHHSDTPSPVSSRDSSPAIGLVDGPRMSHRSKSFSSNAYPHDEGPSVAHTHPPESNRPSSEGVWPSDEAPPSQSSPHAGSPTIGFLGAWKSRKNAGAQRQSKEAQLKRREAELIAMRERSRAVLQKRTQLYSHERQPSDL